MSEQKLNKDGLIPGSLVTAQQVAKVNRQKQQAKQKALANKKK